jgi:flagellar assembly factor FliW
MPSITTKQFGIVQFAEEDVFEFPNGLPGFEAEHRFLCIERPALRPVVFLQSITRTDLCFITLPARSVDPGYELEVAVEERTVLGLAAFELPVWDQSLACLAIVCLPTEGNPTANLLGPVVLSRETHKGVQAVRDDRRYSALTPLQPATPDQNPAGLSPVGGPQADGLAEA